jgi:hypothetical protein
MLRIGRELLSKTMLLLPMHQPRTVVIAPFGERAKSSLKRGLWENMMVSVGSRKKTVARNMTR